MNTLPSLDNLLHARTGPMTTELVQHPAAFGLGLGRVPARLAPVATTNTVRGSAAPAARFASTSMPRARLSTFPPIPTTP